MLLHIALFAVLASTANSQEVASTFVKGRRGGSVTLACFVEEAVTSTISWTKNIGGSVITLAHSVGGKSVIHNVLSGRAVLEKAHLSIYELKISDSGLYTCTVLSAGGAQTTLTSLDVTAAPSVNAEAVESPTIDSSGKYVAAICRAIGGKPAAEVRWADSQGKILESSTSSLVAPDGSHDVVSRLLLSPGLADGSGSAGSLGSGGASTQTFTCLISHDDLSSVNAKSTSVSVHLLYAPLVYIQLLGNRLTCKAEGNPPPAIRWILPDGDVLRDVTTLYLGEGRTDGRYACIATSSLAPEAVSTLQVQRAKDLPTLFRTLTELNTSLPVSASGYTVECAADVTTTAGGRQDQTLFDLDFVWIKNGQVIEEPSREYDIRRRVVHVSSTTTRVTSWLRFVDVRRGRDDATFRCRMTNTSTINGFVSAMERSVRIRIDYPPESSAMRIFAEPRHAIVMEGEDLTLSCRVLSQPESVYFWYYEGERTQTEGANSQAEPGQLHIAKIGRRQAGVYRCLAYNYVPGSAQAEINVVVRYPPSKVAIVKNGDGNLSCMAKGGSSPPPIYTWIFPNGTRTSGNHSTVALSSSVVEKAVSYLCVVNNGLGVESNASYLHLPPPERRIGNLSVIEFASTIVVCSCLFIVLLCVICWLVYRRCHTRKESAINFDKTFKKYMQYSEPPDGVMVPEPGCTSTPNGVIPRCQSDLTADLYGKSRHERKHPPIKEVSYADCKSPIATVARKDGFGSTPDSVQYLGTRKNVQLTKPRKKGSPIKSTINLQNEIERSSVEIIENESLQSTSNNGDSQQANAAKPPTGRGSSPKRENPDVRRNTLNRLRGPNGAPLQYFHQATLPRAYLPSLHPAPIGVLMPGYDPTLYDDTWRPGMQRYPYHEGADVRPYATLDVDPRRYRQFAPPPATTTTTTDQSDTITSASSTVASEDFLHGVKCTRPRAMSLSGSETSTSSSSSSASTDNRSSQTTSEVTRSAATKPTCQSGRPSKHPTSPCRNTASPFDSGNDSVKSIPSDVGATKKPQSLTLV